MNVTIKNGVARGGNGGANSGGGGGLGRRRDLQPGHAQPIPRHPTATRPGGDGGSDDGVSTKALVAVAWGNGGSATAGGVVFSRCAGAVAWGTVAFTGTSTGGSGGGGGGPPATHRADRQREQRQAARRPPMPVREQQHAVRRCRLLGGGGGGNGRAVPHTRRPRRNWWRWRRQYRLQGVSGGGGGGGVTANSRGGLAAPPGRAAPTRPAIWVLAAAAAARCRVAHNRWLWRGVSTSNSFSGGGGAGFGGAILMMPAPHSHSTPPSCRTPPRVATLAQPSHPAVLAVARRFRWWHLSTVPAASPDPRHHREQLCHRRSGTVASTTPTTEPPPGAVYHRNQSRRHQRDEYLGVEYRQLDACQHGAGEQQCWQRPGGSQFHKPRGYGHCQCGPPGRQPRPHVNFDRHGVRLWPRCTYVGSTAAIRACGQRCQRGSPSRRSRLQARVR